LVAWSAPLGGLVRRRQMWGRTRDRIDDRETAPYSGLGFIRLRFGRLPARAHWGAVGLPDRVVLTIPGCKVDVGAADSHDRRVLAMNLDRSLWYTGGASDSRN
jgi:hypothetical protein